MTREQAMTLCGLLGGLCSRETGFGRTNDDQIAKSLKSIFPEFNWRVILSRQSERSRWVLTVDDNDKREHYVPVGGTCIHCGKTAAELGVEERDD